MKLLIKLAIAALMLNAAYQFGSAYLSSYEFKDASREAALQRDAFDENLKTHIMELSSEYDIPLDEDNLDIRHDDRHTYIEASYVRPIAFVPGYEYPWDFTWSIDVYVITPVPKVHKDKFK